MRFRAPAPLAPRRTALADPFSDFRAEMDDLFGRFFGGQDGSPLGAAFSPNIDVKETDKEIILKADLPGIEEDDVHLEIHDDLLTLRGERMEEKEEEDENTRLVERSYGRFERAMRLPFSPQDKDVSTDFKKGVLTVRVKKSDAAKPGARRIPISKAK